MLVDEMTEEQMFQAMLDAQAFEMKIRKNLMADILGDLADWIGENKADDAGLRQAMDIIKSNHF